jgi:putative DNA primase/helicase
VADLKKALVIGAKHPVFPCGRDKRPLTKHGFKDATKDRATIEKWWGRWPTAMIGVPTGKVSGFFVVDVDPDGTEWLEKKRKYLPITRIHKTPRGQHLLFKYVPGAGCSTSKVAPGVDVRGDGGYIIWWPSESE